MPWRLRNPTRPGAVRNRKAPTIAILVFQATNEPVSVIWADVTGEDPNTFVNFSNVSGILAGFTSGGQNSMQENKPTSP